ncbi:hypothetical protein ACLI08_03420 [Flavobacterium sp. RNTU_13]|uniref:hypothetical protein n=1 Tax=Flavobacterium sp. RNTU_13 TaxID=3375145 RepID=UPI003987011F
MKLFFTLIFCSLSYLTTPQISGQFYRDGFAVPVIDPLGNVDFDGNFSVNLPTDNPVIELIFKVYDFKVKIVNIPKDLNKINLGIIELPERKSIDLRQYELLSAEQKKDYYPVNHYANFLGYEHKTLLDKDYILFTCNGLSKQVKEFSFDWKMGMITIDARKITYCN